MKRLPFLLAAILLSSATSAALADKPLQVFRAPPTDELGSPLPPPKINTPGWADSPYITPDGKALYFMYSRYNFFPAIKKNGPPKKMGPDRLEHNDNDANPYGDSDIYVSRIDPVTGKWRTPANVRGVNDPGSNCCAIFVKGPPTRIYQQRDIPGNGSDLFYNELGPGDIWDVQVAFPPPINTRYNEANIHVSADHRRIYFTSDRPGGYGNTDIWFAYRKPNGSYSIPANLGPVINTAAMEDQFWMADTPDAQGNYEVYFNRTGGTIMRSLWNAKTGFSQPQPVDLGVQFAAEASLTQDGKKLYFASGNPDTEQIQIMVSDRRADGSWTPGRPVD